MTIPVEALAFNDGYASGSVGVGNGTTLNNTMLNTETSNFVSYQGSSYRIHIYSQYGTFRTGTFSANDFIFTGPDAAAIAAGTFTRIDDRNMYISNLNLSGSYALNVITILGEAQASPGEWSAVLESILDTVTSPVFTTSSANNTVTITLTGGTFRTGTFSAIDFGFSGTDSRALALGNGIFTRTSDTVVTITNLALSGGADNIVSVLGEAQATQAGSVAAVASGP